MRKAARHFSAVIGRVIFIGLSVQAVLGLLWMLCNFTAFQEYGDSLFLEKVSKSLICDDHTGILYPLLIRAARGIASVVPVPYYCLLYLLQLGAGYAAAFFFLKVLLSHDRKDSEGEPPLLKKEILLIHWGALILVTVPVAMQCHLAVLPCSLTGSLLLWQLGVFLRAVINEGEKNKNTALKVPCRTEALLGAIWLLETLLMPEYLWIGVIPVSAYCVLKLLRPGGEELTKRLGVLLVAAAFLGVTPLALELTTQPGAYGRMENTIEGTLMRRVCGGYLQEYYGNWPRELRDRISQEDLAECMSGSEAIDRVMGREVESVLDDRTVGRLYLEMVRLGWECSGRTVARNMALDMLGYGFAPALSRVYLRMAYYDSYTRGNYDVMRRQAPRLTYFAVGCGGYCFALGLGLTAALQLASRLARPRKEERGKKLFKSVVCGGMGLWICLWYTMQGQGRMDYKYSLAVTALWFAWMCCGAIREIGQEPGE